MKLFFLSLLLLTLNFNLGHAADNKRIVGKKLQELQELSDEVNSIAKYFEENPITVKNIFESETEKMYMTVELNKLIFHLPDHAPIILVVHSVRPKIASINDHVFYSTTKDQVVLNNPFRKEERLFKIYSKLSQFIFSTAQAEWGGWTRDLYEGVARGVEEKVYRYEEATGRLGIPDRPYMSGDGAGASSLTYLPSKNDFDLRDYRYYRSNKDRSKLACFDLNSKEVAGRFCEANEANFMVSMGDDDKLHCYHAGNRIFGVLPAHLCGYRVLADNNGKKSCYLRAGKNVKVSNDKCGVTIETARNGRDYCYFNTDTKNPVEERFCGYRLAKTAKGKVNCYSNVGLGKRPPVDGTLCGLKPKVKTLGPESSTSTVLKIVNATNTLLENKKSLTQRMNEEFDQYQCLILNGVQGITKNGNKGISLDTQGNISICVEKNCKSYLPGKNPNSILNEGEAQDVVEKFKVIDSNGRELLETIEEHSRLWSEYNLPKTELKNMSFIDEFLLKINGLEESKKMKLQKNCSLMKEKRDVMKSQLSTQAEENEGIRLMLSSFLSSQSDVYCINPPAPVTVKDLVEKAKKVSLDKALVINETALSHPIDLLKEYSECCQNKKCKDSIFDNENADKEDPKISDGKRDSKSIKIEPVPEDKKSLAIPK